MAEEQIVWRRASLIGVIAFAAGTAAGIAGASAYHPREKTLAPLTPAPNPSLDFSYHLNVIFKDEQGRFGRKLIPMDELHRIPGRSLCSAAPGEYQLDVSDPKGVTWVFCTRMVSADFKFPPSGPSPPPAGEPM
jgi:hypothetical protein